MSLASYLIRLRSRIERAAGMEFPGSATYWERRYSLGGNSGAGSYGRLARFKADYLNRFVATHAVRSVIEFGCGDGNQLSLASYPLYFGVDVSERALEFCRARFDEDISKRFDRCRPPTELFDLSLSLDVIYHLIEDSVFEAYMHELFEASRRWVIVYSSDPSQAEIHVGRSSGTPHVRHRPVNDWIAVEYPAWRLVRHDENAYPFDPADPDNTSFSDFFVYERGSVS